MSKNQHTFSSGEKNPRYNPSAERVDSHGYVVVRVPVGHPCGWNAGCKNHWYARKHVLVYYEAKGVKASRGFHVHHKDENKLNNDISNLELIATDHHGRYHAERRPRELGEDGREGKFISNKEAQPFTEDEDSSWDWDAPQ